MIHWIFKISLMDWIYPYFLMDEIESNPLKINCLTDGSNEFYSRWTG